MPRSAPRRRAARESRALFLAVSAVAMTGATACGLDLTGTSEGFDAGVRIDAGGLVSSPDATVGPTTDGDALPAPGADAADSPDASPSPAPDTGPVDPAADAGTDAGCATGLFCGGQCSPTSSCNACAAGNLECTTGAPRTCTGSCASDCPGSPVECYQCGSGATGGVCQPPGTAYCFTTFYTHCKCAVDDPSTCPIGSQVCVPVLGGAECRTCGEAQTDKRDCKNGKKCDAKAGGPGGGQAPVCAG